MYFPCTYLPYLVLPLYFPYTCGGGPCSCVYVAATKYKRAYLVLVEEGDAERRGRGDAHPLGRRLAEVGRDVGEQVEGALRRGARDGGDLAEQPQSEVALLAQLGHVRVQLAARRRVGPRLECGDARVLRDRRGAPAPRVRGGVAVRGRERCVGGRRVCVGG